jgi:hypothetical protein
MLIASYALAAARLLSMPKIDVLWRWAPPKMQPLLFALPDILTQLAGQLGLVDTKLELAEAIAAAALAILIAIRGGTPPGGGNAAVNTTLNVAARMGQAIAAVCLATFVFGCSPSSWEAQRGIANAIETAADRVAYPALERAYESDGIAAVMAADTPLDAELRKDVVRRQWLPIWSAWDAFAAAHSAWVTAIETEGDALATGDAARRAYCKLRNAAAVQKVDLPDFPAFGCKP